jgi:thiol-disulfide isomerase/thioredoxin
MDRQRRRGRWIIPIVVLLIGSACGSGSGAGSEVVAGPTTAPPVDEADAMTDTADSPDGAAGSGERAENPVDVALTSLDGLDLLDGGTFALGLPPGHPAVVWFWAPWCPNCRAMGPGVADLTAAHAGEITVLGVAGRGAVDEMHEFVADTGTEVITHVIDGDGSIWSEFEVYSQPAFAFVKPDGSIEVSVGRMTQDALAARFAALLAG